MSRSVRERLTGGTFLAVLISAAVGNACAPPPAASAQPRKVIRFTTGPLGGGFYPLGEGLARAYASSVPGVTIEPMPSGGAVANAEAIQQGSADIGFAFADVAYIAFGGGIDRGSRPYDRLRGIAVLQLTPLHFVVRAQSGIQSINDLRGRRVSVGLAGTGTALTVQLVLKAFDLDRAQIVEENFSFDEAARRLVDGSLDAMFDTAIYPAHSVEAATDAGARLLPLVGPSIERLRHDYPFFRSAVIPRHTYPGVLGAVRTIGVDSLFICSRDLDESLVHDLTKGFFDALPSLSSSVDALRFMDLEQSPATPIPLHAGAARFYRERELQR
jgi:TRAP transporter TAXI family solute receptor